MGTWHPVVASTTLKGSARFQTAPRAQAVAVQPDAVLSYATLRDRRQRRRVFGQAVG